MIPIRKTSEHPVRSRASLARLLLALLVVSLLLATAAMAADDTGPAAELRLRLNQARKLGAKGQLPIAYWDLDARLDAAEKNGAGEDQWERMRTDAQRLLNRIQFVNRMREQKSAVEALLGRFDQALAEIAALYGVETDPVSTGSEAAEKLLMRLNRRNLQRQVLIDSLVVENRKLREVAGGRTAATDSLVTALQVEVSALRKELWETQLRVGVAEADRSAAETVLSAKQQREAAIAELREQFGPDEAEILLTPDGGAILRVYGIAFGVGSAEVGENQTALLAKVAEAVRVFPGAGVRVEGHTDNTGSRQANLRLSRRRAEAVARWLEKDLGFYENEITTEGFGPDRPLALNDTPEGRRKNRRIDVIVGAVE